MLCTLTRKGDEIAIRIGSNRGLSYDETYDPDLANIIDKQEIEKKRIQKLQDMQQFLSESNTSHEPIKSYIAIGIQNCIYIPSSNEVMVGVRYKSPFDANDSKTSLSLGNFNTGYKLIRSPSHAENMRSVSTLEDLFVTQQTKHFVKRKNSAAVDKTAAEISRNNTSDFVYQYIENRLRLFGSRLFKVKLIADENYNLDYGWASLLINNSTWRPRFEIGIWKYMEIDYDARRVNHHLKGIGEDVFQDYRGNIVNPGEQINFWVWCHQGKIRYRSYPEEQYIKRNIPQRQVHRLSHSVLVSTRDLIASYGIKDNLTLFAPDELLHDVDNTMKIMPGTPATRLLTWF